MKYRVSKEGNSGSSGDAASEDTYVDENVNKEAYYFVYTEEVDEEKVWYDAILSVKHRRREAYSQVVYWWR